MDMPELVVMLMSLEILGGWMPCWFRALTIAGTALLKYLVPLHLYSRNFSLDLISTADSLRGNR